MKTIIDDGFNSELVQNAAFDGEVEIPTLNEPTIELLPETLVPFTKRNYCRNPEKAYVCFYEHDLRFKDLLVSPDKYASELAKFAGIISPDCSLYWDMPLCLQVANIYMNRAIAYYYQTCNLRVIPNVRWGDERTFTTQCFPDKVAFLGIPKHSIVSIGTYGCIRGKEKQSIFRAGLIAMLDELQPETVLVYGSMPASIFGDLLGRTHFVQYPDWISSQRRRIR